MKNFIINETLIIPAKYLTITAVRSSGAGGQNVNKVASKVELRFDYKSANLLAPSVIERLLNKVKLDSEGNILIISQKTRDQFRNIEDAKNKLTALINEALIDPVERIDTSPTTSSINKRLNNKKEHSQKKQNRNWKIND